MLWYLEQELELEPERSLGKCQVSVESLGLHNAVTGQKGRGLATAGHGRQPGPKRGAESQTGERGPGLTSRPFFQDLKAGKDLRDRLYGRYSVTEGDTEAQNGESVQSALGGHSRASMARGAPTPHLVLIPLHQDLKEVTSG